MTGTRRVTPVLVITAVGLSAVMLAAFVQHTTAAGVAGSPEAVTHATVPGTQVGVLLPGEKAYITLTLTNPHANVKAKLQPVSAGDVVIDTVANPADKAYCHDQIELSTVGAALHRPTLDPNETNHHYKMVDAVALKADTDIRCQAMTYHTTWIARFKPVH
ncbi:hypothetical protein [Amycolatopsis sp. cmx-11-51]|uniref:hypothetical protein n=1 Tax=Amycolatopsis sp. cmx-11-51 TaxID=2785797 RepID=UPI0039E297F0